MKEIDRILKHKFFVTIIFFIVVSFAGSILSGVDFNGFLRLTLSCYLFGFLPGYYWLPIIFRRNLDVFETIGWGFILSLILAAFHIFILNIVLRFKLTNMLLLEYLFLVFAEAFLYKQHVNRKKEGLKVKEDVL